MFHNNMETNANTNKKLTFLTNLHLTVPIYSHNLGFNLWIMRSSLKKYNILRQVLDIRSLRWKYLLSIVLLIKLWFYHWMIVHLVTPRRILANRFTGCKRKSIKRVKSYINDRLGLRLRKYFNIYGLKSKILRSKM